MSGTGAVRTVVSGRVQGVGFRYWTRRKAEALGLTGWVRNRHDGTVEALFTGPEAAVAEMLTAIRRGPRLADVTGVEEFAPEEADAGSGGFAERETV